MVFVSPFARFGRSRGGVSDNELRLRKREVLLEPNEIIPHSIPKLDEVVQIESLRLAVRTEWNPAPAQKPLNDGFHHNIIDNVFHERITDLRRETQQDVDD